MSTLYSERDRAFTEKAHLVAQQVIYPEFFKCAPSDIGYQDGLYQSDFKIELKLLDTWMAIDRILRVPAPVDLGWLEFTAQERFERPSAASYRNVSVTHLNTDTETLSELYKIKASYFVSGYFDEHRNVLVGKMHVCSVERMLKAIQDNELNFYKKPNNKNQDFVTFGYEDLERVGAVLMRIDFDFNPYRVYWPDKELGKRLGAIESGMTQLLDQTKSAKPIRRGNVVDMTGELFKPMAA